MVLAPAGGLADVAGVDGAAPDDEVPLEQPASPRTAAATTADNPARLLVTIGRLEGRAWLAELMESVRMLAQLASDGAALRDAATDLDKPVPTCPGWTVRDAVLHTGEVYAHKATIVENNLTESPDPWPPEWDIADPLAWFAEQHQRVLETLGSRDPGAAVGTWYDPEQNVGFWVRRMMQETVIHRADVESATGAPSRVDAEVALDGIDELVERMLCYWVEDYLEAPGSGQRVLIESAGSAWTVTLGPAGATFDRSAATDVDATVSGDPSEVLLALWNRLPYDVIGPSGDAGALAALRAAVVATTQ